jgi:hypothetical protein
MSKVMPSEIFDPGQAQSLFPGLGVDGFDGLAVVREHEPWMLSELPLDYLTPDFVKWNADTSSAFRLVGMNPRDVALHIHLAPLEPLHVGLPQTRGERKLRHIGLVFGQCAQ